jgi:hypothetical protein
VVHHQHSSTATISVIFVAGIFSALFLLIFSAQTSLAQGYTTRKDLPANTPFKRASRPINRITPPLGPRTTIAAPVDSVSAEDTSIPELQAIQSQDLPPVTTQNAASEGMAGAGPIFKVEDLTNKVAILRNLNKVTARYEDILIPLGEEISMDNLLIRAVTCRTSSADSQPESAALLVINESQSTRSDGEESLPQTIFKGWVFASSPSLNGLEHPVYDISLIGCEDKKEAKSQT